jgi:hypothetical protein
MNIKTRGPEPGHVAAASTANDSRRFVGPIQQVLHEPVPNPYRAETPIPQLSRYSVYGATVSLAVYGSNGTTV